MSLVIRKCYIIRIDFEVFNQLSSVALNKQCDKEFRKKFIVEKIFEKYLPIVGIANRELLFIDL